MSESDDRLLLPGTDAPGAARRQAVKARRVQRPKPPNVPAPELPVAQVAVDVSLPHLDRPFDYLVTESQHEQAVAGCRVRVRFAGRLVDGFLLERTTTSLHTGRLAPLSRVVSAEPVLTEEIVQLARSVADRYAGTLSDVLRLAVPPRHAAEEKKELAVSDQSVSVGRAVEPDNRSSLWHSYENGQQFLTALSSGGTPRAVWSALPGPDWPTAIAQAVAATSASGRGSLVVVPDHRDIARVDAALTDWLGPNQHVVLSAGLGPRERYRRWLAIRRGYSPVVLGTRAAAFAPVANLGLAVIWDDGDDLHAELRAPYPHAREVLALRAHQGSSALLLGGFSRTAEGASLVDSGYARAVVPPRALVTQRAPRVRATDDGGYGNDPQLGAARLPHLAWQGAQQALKDGPVLIQVPRGGYVPAVACSRCQTRAHCSHCRGPLALGAHDAEPTCRWCGTVATAWICEECGHTLLRAQVVGARRTAEELGRAFPSTTVITSGGESVLNTVPDRPALVIATPGAEPVAAGGYAGALLLDTWALLARADLRANEEALRRWMAASALVRPAAEGGRVVIVADARVRPVQALVRWDPAGHAERELADRTAVGLPPAMRVAELRGKPDAVQDLVTRCEWPPESVVLGPAIGADGDARVVIRTPRTHGLALSATLHRGAGERSARKDANPVTIRIDPVRL